MFTLNALVFTLSLFIVCNAGYVERLTKCSIKDSKCIQALYQKTLKEVGKSGVPELNIPPLDPMELKNVSITLFDAVTLTITEGTVKGMGNCVFNEYLMDIEKHKGSVDVTCDLLTIKGHFMVVGESPEIQSFIGNSKANAADGKAKIKLQKINTSFDYEFYPVQKDGEIYLTVSTKNKKYKFEIGSAHFVTEDINVDGKDISQLASDYFNDNWRSLMKSFGPIFTDTLMEIYGSIIKQFGDSIPAKHYITEDLKQYL